MPNSSFDNRVKNLVGQDAVTPPEGMYNRIEQTLENQGILKPRPGFGPARTWLSSLAIASLAGGAIFLFLHFFAPEQVLQDSSQVTPNPIPDKNLTNKISQQKNSSASVPNTLSPSGNPKQAAKGSGSTESPSEWVVCGLETRLDAGQPKGPGHWVAVRNGSESGILIIADPLDPFSKVKANRPGRYALSWEVSGAPLVSMIIDFRIAGKDLAGPDFRSCDHSIRLQGQGTTGQWVLPHGLGLANPADPASMVVAALPGKYQLVWIEKQAGCEFSDTASYLFLTSPEPSLSISGQAQCAGSEVEVQASPGKGRILSWILDGEPLPFKGSKIPLTILPKPQLVEVETRSDEGCSARARLKIPAGEKIRADFFFSFPEPGLPSMVYFANQTEVNGQALEDRGTYRWHISNGVQTEEASPEVPFTRPGRFTAKLVATSPTGCTDSISKNNILIQAASQSSSQNVFTPNGDGRNDLFVPESQGILQFRCIVFNAKGERIAEITEAGKGWDGLLKSGNPALTGHYFYVISGENEHGRPIEKQGVVYLFRD